MIPFLVRAEDSGDAFPLEIFRRAKSIAKFTEKILNKKTGVTKKISKVLLGLTTIEDWGLIENEFIEISFEGTTPKAIESRIRNFTNTKDYDEKFFLAFDGNELNDLTDKDYLTISKQSSSYFITLLYEGEPDHIVHQAYEDGEYDSGYYSNEQDDAYVLKDGFQEIENKLRDHENVLLNLFENKLSQYKVLK